jgi:adenylate kinase family enzyme
LKLWIVGPPGSGKSTLADRLGPRLSCPVVHLDELHWLPGWKERDGESFRALVDEATSGPARIVEGNYQVVRRHFLERADQLVWLDFPLPLCLWRLLRRCVSRACTRELICNGNRESLWMTFCSRESLLWWAITTDRKRRRQFEWEFAERGCVRLRSGREVEKWAEASDAGGLGK